jgi:predicted MPP superfamily phosphohydrolase
MGPGDLVYNLLGAGLTTAFFVRLRTQDDLNPIGPQMLLAIALQVAAIALFIPLYEDIFGVVRLLAWGAFVWAPVSMIGAAALTYGTFPRTAIAEGIAAALVIGIGVDAFVREPHHLVVRHYAIHSPKVGAPFTIAVVSDIQIWRVGPYERDAIARLVAGNPDLVLFTGDYVQGSADQHRELDPQFNRLIADAGLHPRLGMYAVGGNVDWTGNWPALFAGTGVQASGETRRYAADGVTIDGLSFEDGFDPNLHVDPGDGFHVVFAHGPDFALGDVHADLLVAGHTHGGQVVVPLLGPPVTFAQIPRSWAGGQTDLGDGRTLIVSRGIGMERGNAPQLRLNCLPELVFIDVSR